MIVALRAEYQRSRIDLGTRFECCRRAVPVVLVVLVVLIVFLAPRVYLLMVLVRIGTLCEGLESG